MNAAPLAQEHAHDADIAPAMSQRERALSTLRDQGCALVGAMIDSTAAWLATRLPAPERRDDDEATLAALGGAARQRQEHARRLRALAEALVLGAVINQDNPGWDPFDPATSRQGTDSRLCALLRGAGMTEGA